MFHMYNYTIEFNLVDKLSILAHKTFILELF